MPAGLSSSPLPKKKANCMIIEATLAKKLATVMISTSRFLMCDSSWAITPSSSAGESVFMIPVVAHTVAFFWDRPSAKALGTRCVGDRDLRLGQVGLDAEPVDHGVQARGLLGRDLLGAHRGQRQLVRGEQLEQRQAADEHGHHGRADAGRQQRAGEGDVQQAQQEHGRQHPDLEAGVALEDRLGSRHLKRSVGKGCTILCTPGETGLDRDGAVLRSGLWRPRKLLHNRSKRAPPPPL